MTLFDSSSRSKFILEHDLFRKPVPTFRDHALRVRGPGNGHRTLRIGPPAGGRPRAGPLHLATIVRDTVAPPNRTRDDRTMPRIVPVLFAFALLSPAALAADDILDAID